MKNFRKIALLILDGWGIRERYAFNPTKIANIPNYNNWLKNFECAIIDASEEFVGLSKGQMGNSEVGHLNLGAGTIVLQDISRIDKSILENSFNNLEPLITCAEKLKDKRKNVHIVGLLSDGGVHSHQNHLYALIDFFTSKDLCPVLHIITDGRDTPPKNSINYLDSLTSYIGNRKVKIASVSGRYYAMDRDKRWDRTELAYEAIIQHLGNAFNSPQEAVLESYKNGITDEFIIPSVIGPTNNDNVLNKDDYLVFFNFRADRMRQLVESIVGPQFKEFQRKIVISGKNVITFINYDDIFKVQILFPQQIVKTTLAKVISDHNLTQFHAAETEKYPHVTYFFNGRREEPFVGEERLLIPSPKVKTYDLKPEMSAYELTNGILERIRNFDDNFILINFANPDMVGHTGILNAAIKAIEVVDECADRIVKEIVRLGGVALVTSDHGNIELMFDEIKGEPYTSHTTNPVRLIAISKEIIQLKSRGVLADVAPTILDLMGLEKPNEMMGNSLLKS